MNQTVKYSISIDNQHCIDCANFKNLIETAQNMQLVLNCAWSRIMCLDKYKFAMSKVSHVRIDFKLHGDSSNYEYLHVSDECLIWDYDTRQITDRVKKDIRDSIKVWM